MAYTDTERLDFLQKLTEQKHYTGKVCLRWSQFRRGWRLYETSREDAQTDVRNVIDKAMDEGMKT